MNTSLFSCFNRMRSPIAVSYTSTITAAAQLARTARYASIRLVAFSSPFNVPLVFGHETRVSPPLIEERTERVAAASSQLKKSAAPADLVIIRSPAIARYLVELGRRHPLWPERIEVLGRTLLDLIHEHPRRSLPLIGLISLLNAKEREVKRFLESALRQRYAGLSSSTIVAPMLQGSWRTRIWNAGGVKRARGPYRDGRLLRSRNALHSPDPAWVL